MQYSAAGQVRPTNPERFPLTEQNRHKLNIAFLVLTGIIVYLNSLKGVFVMDDLKQIVNNENIRSFSWSFFSNVRRPFLYLTLMLNYAVNGLNPLGYHIGNVAVHIGAAIFLYKIIVLAMSRPAGKTPLPYSSAGVAFAVSLLWLAHPIQTQSVTYLIQRAESLAGMLYLASFYYALRYMSEGRIPLMLFSFAAFLLSGLTKENAVTLPAVVFLYDRAFISSSAKEAWRRHKTLYILFGLVWLVMGWLLWSAHPEENPSAGFGYKGITPWQYAVNQPAVILHYLKLLFWPGQLVFDYYGWPVRPFAQNLLPMLFCLILCGGALWLYRRKPSAGFAAVTFFLLLSPSSSFLPLRDLAFEYRLYLPSACFIFLAVTGIAQLLNFLTKNRELKMKAGIILLCVVFFGNAFLTIERNRDYYDAIRLWQDTVVKRSTNARAFFNLGTELLANGQSEKAVWFFRKAFSLEKGFVSAYVNLGTALESLGWLAKAEKQFRFALGLEPKHVAARSKLGMVLIRQGRLHEALVEYQLAAEYDPQSAKHQYNWGAALLQLGRAEEAMPVLEKSVELGFAKPKVFWALAICYDKMGQKEKALQMKERAQREDSLLHERE